MPRRHLALLAIGAVGGVAVYPTALASWGGTGGGAGQARAPSAQTVTVDAAVGGDDLYPGFTGGDVFFTVSNPNPFPLTFTSMTPGSLNSSDPIGCPASNVTASSKSGLGIAVGGGATTPTLAIADVVSMSAVAPDECQGIVFTVSFTLDGVQT